MNKDEAIKYLNQLYPNGGHCWLDEQRIEAIGMAVKALQEEPVSEFWHDSNKEQPKAESDVAIWDGERGEILTRCVKVNPNRKWAYMEDMLNKKEEPVSEDLEKEIDKWWWGKTWQTYGMAINPNDIRDFAKHFFELGMQQSKNYNNNEEIQVD